MKIKQITLEHVKGASIDYSLSKPLVLAGGNRSHKTAVLAGVLAALSKSPAPEGFGRLGGSVRLALQTDEGVWHIVKRMIGVSQSHAWTMENAGQKITSVREMATRIEEMCGPISVWHLGEFVGLSDVKQRDLLAGIVGHEAPDVVAQVAAEVDRVLSDPDLDPDACREMRRHADSMLAAHGQDALAVLLSDLPKMRKNQNAVARQADAASKHHLRAAADVDEGDRELLQAELADLLEQRREREDDLARSEERASAIASMSTTLESLKAALEREQRSEYDPGTLLIRLEDLRGRVSDAEDEECSATARLQHLLQVLRIENSNALKASLNATSDALATARAASADGGDVAKWKSIVEQSSEACMLCGSDASDRLEALRKRADFAIRAAQRKQDRAKREAEVLESRMVEIDRALSAVHEVQMASVKTGELQPQLRSMEEQLRDGQERFNARRDARIEQLRIQIESLENPAQRGDILGDPDLLRSQVAALQRQIASVEGRLAECSSSEDVESRALMASSEARQARARIDVYDAMAKALGPAGLLSRLMTSHLEPFAADVTTCVARLEPGDRFLFRADPWAWGIERDALLIPFDALSASEKVAVGAGIAYAIAKRSKLRLLAVDGFDIFVGDYRKRFVEWLGQVAPDLDNIVATCSFDSISDMETMAALAGKGLTFTWCD